MVIWFHKFQVFKINFALQWNENRASEQLFKIYCSETLVSL